MAGPESQPSPRPVNDSADVTDDPSRVAPVPDRVDPDPGRDARRQRRGRLALAGAALLAAVLRLPAYFAARHLTFDDGTFASSVIAMRFGGVPFRQIFSSQAPLFLPLAYLGDTIGLHTMDSPRVIAVVSGVALVIFVHLALRRSASSTAALFGALLVGTSGCVMWVTAPLAADGPALAFAAAAFWLLLIHAENPRPLSAMLVGLTLGASLSTKAMNVPLLIITAFVLALPFVNGLRARHLDLRLLRDPLVGASAALAVFLASALPFGFADVWDQAFRYRTETSTDRDPLRNLAKVISTLWDRDLVLYLATGVTIAWLIRRSLGSRVSTPGNDSPGGAAPAPASETPPWRASPRALAGAWLVLTVLWLALGVNPLWRAHVSAVVLPLVLVLALNAPPARWLLVLAVASLPLIPLQLHGLLPPGRYKGSERAVVELLRSLPPGAWAISDEPGLIWRADRRTTDFFVDPSVLRIQTGRYDEDDVISAAANERVCAVVVRSNARFGSFPLLGQRLAALGYVVAQTSTSRAGDAQRVYVKAACSPPA